MHIKVSCIKNSLTMTQAYKVDVVVRLRVIKASLRDNNDFIVTYTLQQVAFRDQSNSTVITFNKSSIDTVFGLKYGFNGVY